MIGSRSGHHGEPLTQLNLFQLTREWLPNARECASASERAYDEATFESDLAHCLILPMSDGGTIFAFRGTANIRDWITDLDCLRKGSGIETHAGFYWAAESIQEEVFSHAAIARGPIYFTGHSLGGAIAMRMAWLAHILGGRVDGVFTFGQPRLGNGRFAQAYGTLLGLKTFRFVNTEDPVPRLPGWLAGYRHAGYEIFLPEIGPMRIDPPLWFKLCSDAIGVYRDWQQGPLLAIGDHAMRKYAARIGAGFTGGNRENRELREATDESKVSSPESKVQSRESLTAT